MAALRAFLGGLLGLIVGAIGAAIVSNEVMGWMGVSDFEGGRGMAAVFFWGPVGGIVGLGLGIWLGLRLGRKAAPPQAAQAVPRAPSHTLRNVAIAIGGIVALAAGILAIQYYSVPHRLEYDGSGASLEIELRAPAALATTLDVNVLEISLDTDLNQMPGSWSDDPPRAEGDWTILSGEVELYYRTAQRLLVIRFPDGRDLIFNPHLASKPDPEAGWSDWRKPDFIGVPGQAQTAKPGPDEPYELRYRVRVWGME